MKYLDKSVEEIEQIIKDAEFALEYLKYINLDLYISDFRGRDFVFKKCFKTEIRLEGQSEPILSYGCDDDIPLAIYEDGKAYTTWKLTKKKKKVKLLKHNEALTYIINKKTNNI